MKNIFIGTTLIGTGLLAYHLYKKKKFNGLLQKIGLSKAMYQEGDSLETPMLENNVVQMIEQTHQETTNEVFPLNLGSKGKEVKLLQQALLNSPVTHKIIASSSLTKTGKLDGNLGDGTKKAIEMLGFSLPLSKEKAMEFILSMKDKKTSSNPFLHGNAKWIGDPSNRFHRRPLQKFNIRVQS